jgi:hypothetical protein
MTRKRKATGDPPPPAVSRLYVSEKIFWEHMGLRISDFLAYLFGRATASIKCELSLQLSGKLPC